ncbi:MAG TPA: J domain-containing protein [Nevskia sp.]|nr:J domain-containing protein [Nevskia sp.]
MTPPASTHYETLQVIPSASPEVIRAAYRCLAQYLHPDRSPPGLREECERLMRLVNEAYAVISDPAAREAYDRWLARQQPPGRGGYDPDRAWQAWRGAEALEQEADAGFDEHAAYELIDRELEGARMDRGLWLKAFVESGGDLTRQKLRYVQIRLDQLRTTEKARFNLELSGRRAREHARQAEQIKALKAVFAAGSRLEVEEIERLARAAASDKTLLKAADRLRGNTLLHLAAEAELEGAAEVLLKLGARAEAKNQAGRRPHELCGNAALTRRLEQAAARERG